MHAIGPARWFHWVAAAALLVGATWLLWPRAARVAMPPLPVVAPTPVVRGVPTRAVPCLDTLELPLGVIDGDPVVCGGAGCMRLDLGRMEATLVPRPAASPVLPLAATVRSVAGQWSACRGATCKPVGKQLAAALGGAAHAEATLDLATVVADDTIWNVAADRRVTLQPPEIRPNGPERAITVVGDVLLVKWQGDCTDSLCLISQLVDRRGHELGWVQAGGKVIRLDDAQFLAISQFSVMQIRDLHTGALLSELDPRTNSGDFHDIVRVSDPSNTDYKRYALLRDAGDGVTVSMLDLSYGQIMVLGAEQMTLPSCP